MESSIAEFVRQLACELLPTESRQDQALKLVKCFGHLKKGVGSVHVLRTTKRNFGVADSSKLAMQWCACSKHIRVMVWLHVPGTKLLRVQVANAPTPIRCRQCTCHLQTRSANLHPGAYLLGLLAMIKCSICSYQCDN